MYEVPAIQASLPASAVDRAAEAIARGVASGRYAPGQRLIEADLTRSLQVSRGSLREATRRLAAEGILELEPHRGARVRQLSRGEVADLYRVREALEALAGRLAAERIATGDSDAVMRRWLAEIEANPNGAGLSADVYMADNNRFHDDLVMVAANEVLAKQIASLRMPAVRLQFSLLLTQEHVAESIRQHRRIVLAVLAGDPTRTERAMRDHLRKSSRLVQELPDEAYAD